jgi:hypothetical protein
MSDHSYAQSLQDDENHRLALCGLSFDARVEHELEDQASRHFDFIFTQGAPPQRVNGGRSGLVRTARPATTFFASGRRDPAPHGAKRAQDVWEGSGQHQGSHVLGPPPLSKT